MYYSSNTVALFYFLASVRAGGSEAFLSFFHFFCCKKVSPCYLINNKKEHDIFRINKEFEMSKMLTVLAAVLAVVLMSGCTSMQVANRFNGLPVSETEKMPPKAHVNVTMTGFYLFHCLPIATGSVGSVDKWAIFKDTVSVENAVSVLTREARTQLNCTKIYDLKSSTSSVFMPLLYSFKTVQVSATVDTAK